MDRDELLALRKTAGFNGVQLARALDMHPATLSRYERGHAPIPRLVELSVRYLCEPSLVPKSAGERLVEVIKEVASQ